MIARQYRVCCILPSLIFIASADPTNGELGDNVSLVGVQVVCQAPLVARSGRPLPDTTQTRPLHSFCAGVGGRKNHAVVRFRVVLSITHTIRLLSVVSDVR